MVLLIILCVNVLVGYYEIGGSSWFSWVAWLCGLIGGMRIITSV